MRCLVACALLALLTACPGGDNPFVGSVEFTAPESEVFVNGSLPVRLETSPEATHIDLFVDGQGIARITWPFLYELDTRQLTEGPHELSAKAYFEHDGDSDQVLMTDPKRFIVDRTAPTATRHLPASGESYTRACGIVFHLNEPIVPASLVASLVDVSGQVVPSHAELIDDLTVRITPTGPVTAPTSWSLSLSARDRAGNALAPTPWVLEVPRILEKTLTDSPGSDEMAIARNGSDVALVYQTGLVGEAQSLTFGALCQGTRETQVEPHAGAVTLATAPDGTAYSAHNGVHVHALGSGLWGAPFATIPFATWTWATQLAIGPGNTMALGWRPQQENRCYRAGRIVAGVGEELPALPCGPEGGMASERALVLDGAQRPVFAWLERTSEGEASVRAVAWDGSSWTALGSPMPGSGYELPVLSVDALGRPVIVYTAPTMNQLLVKVWTGTAWESLPSLVGSVWAFPKRLAVSGNNLILAWEQSRNGGGFELRVSVLGAGDTEWRTDAGPFHVLGPSHWGAVSLVTDAAGWSVLAWTNPTSEGRYSIHTAWRNGSLP